MWNYLEIGLHTQFVGEILDILVDEEALGTDGVPEIEKIKPFLFSPDRRGYYGIGEYVGKAFAIGKDIGPR